MPTRSYGTSSHQSSSEGNEQRKHDDGWSEVSQATPKKPAMAKRTRYGRQTVQWPFQSITTIETAISSQLLSHTFTPMPLPLPPRSTSRPTTWAPKRMLPLLHRQSESTLDAGLVPDYVINYIRGETPETVARRKMNDGKLGERGVDVVTGHKVHKSRTALFGYLNDRSSTLLTDGYGDGRSRSSTMQRKHGGQWQDIDDTEAEDSRILLGDDNGSERPTGPRRRPMIVGWRMAVAMNLLLTGLICVVAIVGFSLTMSRGSGGNRDQTVVYTGACLTAYHINLGLHAVVSIFTVVLLAGANYAFQVLSSPTRAEVDAAHARGKWLRIGIPSVRNLFHIGGSRGLAATGLVLVILALQLLYNAAVFTSHTVTNANLVLVAPSFLSGTSFEATSTNNMAQLSHTDILSLQDLANRKALVNMTATDCVINYVTKSNNTPLDITYEAVLMISRLSSSRDTLLQTATLSSSYAVTDEPTSIEYCLAQRSSTPPSCGVNVNLSLLGVATLLNLILVMLLAWLLFFAFKSSSQPILSLGDAVASFSKHKDEHIPSDFLSHTNARGFEEKAAVRRQYWFRIPSVPTWLFFIISWTVPTILAAAVFGISLQSRQLSLTPFGSISSATHADLNTPSTRLGTSTLAALPQLLLALMYLSTNHLLTTYYLSREISLLSRPTRPLRVTSSPRRSQTPSLYLTLPRPWSWFLVIFFMAGSFVLSQSVFAIADMPSNATSNTSKAAIGFSGTGLLILLILLFFPLLVVVSLSLCRLRPRPELPSIRTPTTRDISNFCHPDQGGWEPREA